MKDRKFANSS